MTGGARLARFGYTQVVMKPRVRSSVLVAALAIGSVLACSKEPTEIRVQLMTNLACSQARGASVVGRSVPDDGARAEIVTHNCARGVIGDVYARPGNGRSGSAWLRVLLGVERDVSACTKDDNFDGCIVQRRRLAYLEGHVLSLGVALDQSCIGVPCDESTTCNALGYCVPIDAHCDGDACGIDNGADAATGGRDASVPRDGESRDGSDSGASSDASGGRDGSVPQVCPFVSCSPELKCCGGQGMLAMCVPPTCAQNTQVSRYDCASKIEFCAADQYCVLRDNVSTGRVYRCDVLMAGDDVLCQDDADCPAGRHCNDPISSFFKRCQ